MKAKDFDRKFDRGESVLSQLDLSKATRSDQEQRIGPMGVMGRMTTIGPMTPISPIRRRAGLAPEKGNAT